MSFGVRGFKTKTEFRVAVESGAKDVYLSDTSLFADNGKFVSQVEEGERIGPVVGPDVYHNRKWYATVTRKGGKLKVL